MIVTAKQQRISSGFSITFQLRISTNRTKAGNPKRMYIQWLLIPRTKKRTARIRCLSFWLSFQIWRKRITATKRKLFNAYTSVRMACDQKMSEKAKKRAPDVAMMLCFVSLFRMR